jgi:hypothetical protein
MHYPTDVREQLSGFEKCVGLLRTNWYDNGRNLKAMSYGTAFALTKNLIMTCSHNVYSEIHKTLASEIYFFPGINFDKPNVKPLKCTNGTRIKFKNPNPSYSYLPTQ